METGLTIQQVAHQTGLSIDTLRYYERIELLEPVGRTESGHRRYTSQDLAWIDLLIRLRDTGMLREAEAGWPSAATADLSADRIALTEEEIRERMSGNLCRCGAYANIVPAIAEVGPTPSPDTERRNARVVGDRNEERTR